MLFLVGGCDRIAARAVLALGKRVRVRAFTPNAGLFLYCQAYCLLCTYVSAGGWFVNWIRMMFELSNTKPNGQIMAINSKSFSGFTD